MSDLLKTEQLVCEALVREISNATRWQHVEESWRALLKVRLMVKQMHEEHELFSAAVVDAMRTTQENTNE